MINEANNRISYPSLLYGKGFALDVYLPALVNLGIKNIFITKSSISNITRSNIIEKYREF